MKKSTGERVKELRQSKSLSQQKMADTLGTDQSTYSKYERCIFEFSHEMLIKLSKFFDVTVGQLLGTEEL